MPGSPKAWNILENSSTKNPKEFFQSLCISEETSDTLNHDENQRSSSMFVSLEEFQLTLHVLKRSLHFHFTANISKLFNVVIYRVYNLV